MISNLFGLLSVLAEPKSLKILISTKRSSTPATSRSRYVPIILQILSWYENDLVPDGSSWKSLLKTRKVHLLASRVAKETHGGMISQTEVAMTAFGFMGYVMTRGHILGIRDTSREDLEGFIHFWGVICAMSGVRDEFNMCKHKLEVVEMICEISRRYIFVQVLQQEASEFVEMARAFYEGHSDLLPMVSFEAMMFLNKRTAGVPRYQYRVDVDKGIVCKSLFTQEELNEICLYFGVDVQDNNNLEISAELSNPASNLLVYKKLTLYDRVVVYLFCTLFENNHTWWGHFINRRITDLIVFRMRDYMRKLKKR